MFPTFKAFLQIAQQHTILIVDLCNEPNIISRAQLLYYLERNHVAPANKERIIEHLCRAGILLQEGEQGYIVNRPVTDMVSYFERRGRLTSATFLHEQMLSIDHLNGRLQVQIFAEVPDKEAILDVIDDLYRLVREVRDAGTAHYMACMRSLGDIKRDAASLSQRLTSLVTIQRRHIEPLREIFDPTASMQDHIMTLQRRMDDLESQTDFIANSQELEFRRQRLIADLHYINHILLHNFSIVADAARALFTDLRGEA